MKRILSLILLLACLAMLFSCELHVVTDGTKPATTEASSVATETNSTTAATTVATTAATTAITPVTETVYVTIVNKGTVVLARAEVEAKDLDEDGSVNLYEALKAAHATCPNGGADGFVAVNDPKYGLSMTKLWGEENGGSFGYYQNETSSWSLGDVVHTGDRVVAFSYVDTTSWTDTFCYFDPQVKTVQASETVTLKLTAMTYNDKFELVPSAVAGATIIVNGAETLFTTDAEGNVTLTLESGVNVISASSATLTLIPPIAKITVQ